MLSIKRSVSLEWFLTKTVKKSMLLCGNLLNLMLLYKILLLINYILIKKMADKIFDKFMKKFALTVYP